MRRGWACLLLLASVGLGQPLLRLREHGIGGYAGPHNGVTWFAGGPAVIGGGPGMFLVNPRLGIGWNYVASEGDAGGLSFVYAGPAVEYWFGAMHAASWSIGGLAAYGDLLQQESRDRAASRTGFVGLEATVKGRVRCWRFLGLNLGASYRLAVPVSGNARFGVRDLSGPGAFFGLSYGAYPGYSGPPDGRSLRVAGCWSQKWTWVCGQPLRLDGGGTRLVVARHLLLGVGGYFNPTGVSRSGYSISYGEAGLWVEYVPWPAALVSPSVALMAGLGAPGFTDSQDSTQVFPGPMLDPLLALNFNLCEFLRVAAGVGYRLHAGRIGTPGFSPRDFSGATIELDTKVGEF